MICIKQVFCSKAIIVFFLKIISLGESVPEEIHNWGVQQKRKSLVSFGKCFLPMLFVNPLFFILLSLV